MPDPTAAIGTTVKILDHGIPWLRAKLAGKTIVVVGPAGAGKTSLLAYFRHLHHNVDNRHEPTVGWDRGGSFTVVLGRGQRRYLRQAVDSPGEITAVELAHDAVKRRPHAMLVVLSVKNMAASAHWMTNFFSNYSRECSMNNPRKSRLRLIVIILNKIDLIDSAAVSRIETEITGLIAAQALRSNAVHPRLSKVLLRQCVAVETAQHGDKLIEQIVYDVAVNL